MESTTAQTPAQVGPYLLLDLIGQGGMGKVYRAKDTSLDRIVAVKVADTETLRNPRMALRFVEEARAAAALQHPNIVPVYQAGNENDVPYFSMQLIEGQTLEDILKEGVPDLRQTFEWMIQISDALQFAHKHGMVHLDIKPGNIMIDSFNRAILLDFGLARALQNGKQEPGGPMVASPIFASPEQLLQRETDARSDIYSLGTVFFQLLSGQAPFDGPSLTALVKKKLTTDPPAVITLNPEVPPDVSKLVTRMLRKTPMQRVKSMDEVGEVLRLYRAREDGSVNPALSRITEKIRKVPPFPHVGLQLMKELQREGTNADRLNKIISADSVLAARILKMVNSAYYAIPNEVTTIKLAVSLLGFRQIQDLAFGIYLRELGRSFSSGESGVLLQRYWVHSVATAFLSEGLARLLMMPAAPPGEAYMAGLLHDLGLLVLSRYEIPKMTQAIRIQAEKKLPFDEAEREVVGVTHLDMAAWLANKWELPDGLREVAIHHHTCRPESPTAQLELVVRLADTIATRKGYGFYLCDYGWEPEPPLKRILHIARPDMPDDNIVKFLEDQMGLVLKKLGDYLAIFAEKPVEPSPAPVRPEPHIISSPPPVPPRSSRGLLTRLWHSLAGLFT